MTQHNMPTRCEPFEGDWLGKIAGTMNTTGPNNTYYAGMPCVAFGPEHAGRGGETFALCVVR
jgi:hypothetical protein